MTTEEMFKTTLAAIEQAYQRQCDDVQGEADKVIFLYIFSPLL